MTTPGQDRESYWTNFGLTGDSSQYINQFSNKLGLGAYRDDEEFHRGIFEAFDRNKNGSIEQDELALVLRQIGQNVSAANLQEMVREIDQNTDGQINFSEFMALIRKIKSGNMTYQTVYTAPVAVYTTPVAEVGPGRSSPPNINQEDLVIRGDFQRRGVDGEAFGGHINSLRALDGADSQRQSELLLGLRGKIAGCGGSIDLRGHLGPLNGHMNATRSEHGSLLSENQRLIAQNNKLIGYVKEFEGRQSGWLSRISFLEEERRAMEQYIGRINKENKVLKVSIQERDIEIQRLVAILPQIEEWKLKFEASQAEVQRLTFVVNDLNQQLKFQRDNYEAQIMDLRAEIQVFSRKSSELEILIEGHKMDFSVLNNQAISGRGNHEKLGQFIAGEHESLKVRINNMIASSLQDKLTGSVSAREVGDAELRQRITNNTISYFGRGDGTNIIFDKNTTRQCLSQILTNAYGQSYEEVRNNLAASFDSQWNQTQKHADGNLHREHYQTFFNNALSKSLNKQ